MIDGGLAWVERATAVDRVVIAKETEQPFPGRSSAPGNPLRWDLGQEEHGVFLIDWPCHPGGAQGRPPSRVLNDAGTVAALGHSQIAGRARAMVAGRCSGSLALTRPSNCARSRPGGGGLLACHA